jgi:D-glycero-alpha-D-manno-heptose-7-phosphate kinase
LGGGGTDIPSYYSQFGGFLISAAINKYVYVIINPRFENSIRLSYSRTETVDHFEEIQHPIVRECMRLVGLEKGVEIVSIADLPASTGLGSSSSFTVGLLRALHAYKGEAISQEKLAEEAYLIEVEILKEPIGKQDQYISSFGGVVSMDIEKNGLVHITPLSLRNNSFMGLEQHLLLFYTGFQRSASDVLAEQNQSMVQDVGSVLDAMHQIKEIGYKSVNALVSNDYSLFGDLLNQHWNAKKHLAANVSNPRIDFWYDLAVQNGAIGGKIMGAGGGGFFMFCCPNDDQIHLRKVMMDEGLQEMDFTVEQEGSKILLEM